MPKKSDETITGDIIAGFAASPGVCGTNIRVQTDRGWVRLTGVVDTLEEKTIVEEIARNVDGVAGIENDLVVSSDGAISDLELERMVGDHLIREGLTAIGTRVEAGTAFLMGVVESLAARRRAVEAASAVQGVRDVISKLQIAAGEPVDDATLANDVAEALSDDPRLDIMNLDVRVRDGAILLAGEVATKSQLEVASAVAEAVPGVQYVENRLVARKITF